MAHGKTERLRAMVGIVGLGGILLVSLGMTPAPRGAEVRSPIPLFFIDPCVSGVLGDVTDDGVTSLADAQQVLRAAVALPVSMTVQDRLPTHGDVTGDGSTSLADAQQILRYAIALPVAFPVGEPMCGISVTTTTTGLDLDPDGYALQLDMVSAGTMALNETRELTELSPATYQVDLLGLASNCSVVNGPASRSIDVVVGAAASTTFQVECTRGSVTLRVQNTTTGVNLPTGDYEVTLNGGSLQNMAVDGSVDYPGLSPATYDVTIGNVPGNCSVTSGSETQQVIVDGTKDPVISNFTVNCT